MGVLGVIPARYDSVRFPGKVLIPIDGLPMVARVYYQAIQCRELDSVVIATDSQYVKNAMEELDIPVEMTSSDHATGTERTAEIASRHDDEIVINIQGDEPFISPDIIDGAVSLLFEDKSMQMSTAASSSISQNEWENSNVVKVELDENGFAKDFFRVWEGEQNDEHFKHIGIYAFRRDYLLDLVKMEKSSREIERSLEQMRAMDAACKMGVFVTEFDVIGVNTPDDLNALIEEMGIA
ncbi:MAG: 3-deoxy-manno-octulosonate cytidylyltransferase [Candidatus Marinimicrobia bacterium]|jgi:3-deoxy-manno-octulosonate cytidylyltransferase (CMP-KDO synthetase)|nr:3-deoxy-manno-octulosonate cytidylyltransferase [Candidatus Neomarinimicrobiota bacterium]|tara:strand:- start:268 stop:981 length:714 start_codon:yes stop_codon:yes gene_type:complete